MNTTITINDFNFTIMNAEEGKALLYSDKEEEWDLYSDMKSYCDKKSLTKLKKELGIESKRRIKYVITLTNKHINFKCKQNKKIKYTNQVCCYKEWEGAVKIKFYGTDIHYNNEEIYGTDHPYGDIIIVLENDPEIKKLEKLKKKILKEEIQKKKNEINAISDEKVLNNKYMFFSPSFNT